MLNKTLVWFFYSLVESVLDVWQYRSPTVVLEAKMSRSIKNRIAVFVDGNSSYSSKHIINKGVPPGGVLGPLSFVKYFNGVNDSHSPIISCLGNMLIVENEINLVITR